MSRVPTIEAGVDTEQRARHLAMESLMRECRMVVEHDQPGTERRFLVKATRPDGRRMAAVIKLANQFDVTHVEVTPTSPAAGCPLGETVSLALPSENPEIAVFSHSDISPADLEDAAFLTHDLQTPRSRLITIERREVVEIDRNRYQQLSGNR